MTKISVVIPTYNGARFIREALESVFAQTLPPQEIIVVDDCSTDNTARLVEQLALTAPVPLRVIRLQSNSGGPAHPQNIGVAAARSQWIAMLDQDDRMRPQRLEVQLAALYSTRGHVCVGRSRVLGAADDRLTPIWGGAPQYKDLVEDPSAPPPVSVVPQQVVFRRLLVRQFALTNSALVFHNEVWTQLGGYDVGVRYCTDLEFLLNAAGSYPFVLVGDVVNEYRFDESSLFQRSRTQSMLEVSLVRLLYAYRNLRLAEPEYEKLYWRVRAEVAACRSRREWRQGLSVWMRLFSSGIMLHRAKRKLSGIPAKLW